KKFFGEFLINAQGEDVVAGTRTPQHVTKKDADEWGAENGIDEKERSDKFPSLEEFMPENYKELVEIYHNLEEHYKDMQDLEFTIEKGKLYLLQTRTGKRTGKAAIRIAVEMVKEGLIDKKTAVLRVDPAQLDQLLHPMLDPEAIKANKPVAKGLPASPGAVSGQIVFTALEADQWVENGKKVILVRQETSPDDIKGMQVSEGILTATGGMTSHAAVVGRGMGKCCVVGCGDISIDYGKKEVAIEKAGLTFKEGDVITLDGTTGRIYKGTLATIDPEFTDEFTEFMTWVDEFRTMGVKTNADTPEDARRARDFGAEGIGLCRTEHMFFGGDRIKAMREMILAENLEDREEALAKLLPIQEEDFYGIMKVMKDLPVIVRLLDPPLHEFLPHEEKDQKIMAEEMDVSVEKIKHLVEGLHEFNPML
ncbi:pyruvate, phosphate dikinase, partial [Candidatus Calescamantes bacterium]|nr:pyruvate, phosphate dikinase [Candidatus Calescamantes bacterium]